MIKTKKILFLLLFFLITVEKSNTEINDSLFMTIGDKPITKSDLVDEIKIILILNNESYSPEKRDQLHELAVKSTTKSIKLDMLILMHISNKLWCFNKNIHDYHLLLQIR